MGTPERQWSARMAQHKNNPQDAQKGRSARPRLLADPRFSFHASRVTVPVSDARTPLADFFNILLEARRACFPQGRLSHRLCQVVSEPVVQRLEHCSES